MQNLVSGMLTKYTGADEVLFIYKTKFYYH